MPGPMDPNNMNGFEDELKQAFLRRPAPPGLKRRILNQRNQRRTIQIRSRVVLLQRLAACFVLAATIGGGFTWHYVDQKRKGEAARQQVMTALRITNRTLDQIQARLAARDRDNHE
ncbi:MAG TPA: hypothetical protein VHZ28_03240 [Terracidiphilus sp.]|nr:hypothetical protein [Terracidiphilus sp.]